MRTYMSTIPIYFNHIDAIDNVLMLKHENNTKKGYCAWSEEMLLGKISVKCFGESLKKTMFF